MRRRDFLRGLAAIPLLPAAIRGWADEKAEALEPEPEPQGRGLNDHILGVAMGDPTAVTVTVPGDRLLKITASAQMVGNSKPAMLKIMEGKTTLSASIDASSQPVVVVSEVIVAAKAGLHTYRAVMEGDVIDTWAHRPYILVEQT